MAQRLKILITGANGYLGNYLINEFKKSNFEINFFSRNDIDFLLKNYRVREEFNFKEFLKLNKNYDVIIHTAALPYKNCNKDPIKANIINTKLTEILSNYCTINNCFFIFFSSVQVYGNILNGKYNENIQTRPDSIYSFSKAKAEKDLLNKFSKNLKGSILRIGNIVGMPNSKDSSGWELFSNSAIKEAFFNKKISIKNNPNLRRNFLPIKLLNILLKAILNDLSFNKKNIPYLMNVTTGESKTLLEYAELISKKYNEVFNEKIEISYNSLINKKIPSSVIENDILKNYLMSNYKVSIEEEILNILKNLKFLNF